MRFIVQEAPNYSGDITELMRLNRDWTWTDPLRESTAGVVQQLFRGSNMAIDRVQSLIGLDDEQFREAIRSGRASRHEAALANLPQKERDRRLKIKLIAGVV